MSRLAVCQQHNQGRDEREHHQALLPIYEGQASEQHRSSTLKKGTKIFKDRISKAKILLQQFQSVFRKDDNSLPLEMDGTLYPTLDELTIDTSGVAKLLKNLNPSKPLDLTTYLTEY